MMAQLCAAVSAVPLAQVPERAKSPGLAPPGVRVDSVSVPAPVLLMLIVCVPLDAPTLMLPKASAVALAPRRCVAPR